MFALELKIDNANDFRWKHFQPEVMYRAVDKDGDTIDFYLSEYRDQIAAPKFLKKALGAEHTGLPRAINVDKAPSYPVAVDMAKDPLSHSLLDEYI